MCLITWTMYDGVLAMRTDDSFFSQIFATHRCRQVPGSRRTRCPRKLASSTRSRGKSSVRPKALEKGSTLVKTTRSCDVVGLSLAHLCQFTNHMSDLPCLDTFCAPSSSNLTVMEIVGRIEANQELFQRKYAKKMAAEDEYYKNRYKLTPKDASSASS